MGGGEVPDDLMSTLVTMALAAVLPFLTARVGWFLWGVVCENFPAISHVCVPPERGKTLLLFSKDTFRGKTEQSKNK